jgi:hypothetical protein
MARPLFRPKTNHTCHQKQNPSVETVPLNKRSCTYTLHRKKKVREFPVPSRDVTTKLSLGGNNDVLTELLLPKGSLVNDIPAGDGKLVNLFLRCMLDPAYYKLKLIYR